jgi:hypothetical protein
MPNPPLVIVKIWRCSKCKAELGRGDFPPTLEKCPNCGVQFINGHKPFFDNPPAAPPVGGNPPGFNPGPAHPPNLGPPNPVQPPIEAFQPNNNLPVAASPAPAPTTNSASSSGIGWFFLLILVFLGVVGVVAIVLGILFVRFIMNAAQAASTPTARWRPRRRRRDYDL